MTKRGLALAAVAAALVAGGAAAGALVGLRGGDERALATPLGPTGLRVTTELVPRQPLFGDTVRGVVDVALDPKRVDAGSIRIATGFAPWEVVGRPERERRDVAGTTYLRTTYTLRCTTGPCLPGGATQTIALTPVRVASSRADEEGRQGRRAVVRAEWPLLVVTSRYAASRLDTRDPAPFRADLVSLPPATYRVRPAVLAGGLGVVAALLAALGAGFLALAWPRRAPVPEAEPEPEPSLSPLEQALALLEESARVEGGSERRRALELVAEELEAWGNAELSGAAKVLAWSPGAPPVERTAELAARVRAELETELLARARAARDGADDAP